MAGCRAELERSFDAFLSLYVSSGVATLRRYG